jgi:hypothetical protein
MGGLIRTKGTKRLIAHLNDEFGTYIDFYRAISTQFDPTKASYKGLAWLTLNISDPNDKIHSPRAIDDLVLLPHLPAGPKQKHKNLERRWVWFLDTTNVARGSLTPANDHKIAAAIYDALRKRTGNSYFYTSICFDAVEINGPQDITPSDQPDGNTTYKLIVLNTQPMPAQLGAGLDLDA